MFLAMHQLSVIPTRSWAFIYHGLSSALLLGILCQTKPDPEVHQLQGDLIDSLSATTDTGDVSSSPEPHIRTTARDIELSGHLWRALAALKNIHNHGSVVSSKRNESLATSDNNIAPPFSNPDHETILKARDFPPSDIHPGLRDVAVRTEEAPNDAFPQRVPPFDQHIEVGSIDMFGTGTSNLGWMDNLAPMDLYESIWSGTLNSDDPMIFKFV